MPELILKLGDTIVQRFVFDKDIMSIGRSRDNDVVIENLSVSRNHARIRRQNGKYILTDLNSANGTFVNGIRVSKTEVVDDDMISIGKHKVHFVNKMVSDEDMISDAFGADRTVVVDRAPVPVLVIIEGKLKGKEFPLTKFETSVGKASSNDIVIGDDWFLSRRQAILTHAGSGFEIRDLGGFRKTRVNGVAITEPVILKPGDRIEFGNTKCTYHMKGEMVSPEEGARMPQELGLEDSIYSSGVLEPGAAGFASAVAAQRVLVPPAQAPTVEMIAQVVSPVVKADADPAGDLHGIPTPVEAVIAVAEESPAAGQPAVIEEEPASPPVATAPEPETPRHGRKRSRKERRAAAAQEFVTEHFGSGVVPGPAKPAQNAVPTAEPAPTQAVSSEQLIAEAAVRVGPDETTPPEPGILDQVPHPPQPEPEQKPQAQIPSEVASPSVEDEVRLWEAALQNRSELIRRQAARRLKKLTGKDYAY